jgi:hypothetical protein
MNPKELLTLQIIHVSSVLVLAAYTFYACAAAMETRKRVLMISGLASLFILLTGIRMWQGVYQFHAMGWVILKLVAWLGISALTGMAYRKREKAGMFIGITLTLAVLAVVMVYAKPF